MSEPNLNQIDFGEPSVNRDHEILRVLIAASNEIARNTVPSEGSPFLAGEDIMVAALQAALQRLMSEPDLNQIDFGEPDVSRERETLAFRKVLDQLSELISVRSTEPLLSIDELVTVQPMP